MKIYLNLFNRKCINFKLPIYKDYVLHVYKYGGWSKYNPSKIYFGITRNFIDISFYKLDITFYIEFFKKIKFETDLHYNIIVDEDKNIGYEFRQILDLHYKN
jgi:hypothetical protein